MGLPSKDRLERTYGCNSPLLQNRFGKACICGAAFRVSRDGHAMQVSLLQEGMTFARIQGEYLFPAQFHPSRPSK